MKHTMKNIMKNTVKPLKNTLNHTTKSTSKTSTSTTYFQKKVTVRMIPATSISTTATATMTTTRLNIATALEMFMRLVRMYLEQNLGDVIMTKTKMRKGVEVTSTCPMTSQ